MGIVIPRCAGLDRRTAAFQNLRLASAVAIAILVAGSVATCPYQELIRTNALCRPPN